MKKVLVCLLFSFSLYAEVTPYVAVKPVLGFPTLQIGPLSFDKETNFGFGLAGGVAVSVNDTFGFKVELEPTYRPSMNLKDYPPKYKNTTLMANGSVVFNVGPVSPYVGFGLGFTKVKASNFDYNETDFSYQFGAGVEYKVVEKVGVALGYRYVLFMDKNEDKKYAHDVVATASYYF